MSLVVSLRVSSMLNFGLPSSLSGGPGAGLALRQAESGTSIQVVVALRVYRADGPVLRVSDSEPLVARGPGPALVSEAVSLTDDSVVCSRPGRVPKFKFSRSPKSDSDAMMPRVLPLL
jgi:hypothetical protein